MTISIAPVMLLTVSVVSVDSEEIVNHHNILIWLVS